VAAYESKVDTWLLVTLGLAVAATALPFFFLRSLALSWPALLILAAALQLLLMLVGLVLQIRYELEPAALAIHCGPFRSRIPLEAIVAISPSREGLAAPAASLDRLRIEYLRDGKSRSTLISPKEAEPFVTALVIAAPQLKRSGPLQAAQAPSSAA
jgi:hypothetical protein